MKMRDSVLFDEVVLKFFEPIAARLNLQLSKLEDGIYEMPSPHFVCRIRLHTGHARGPNVLLRPASVRDFNENVQGMEFGIGCFIEFQGEKLQETFIDVYSDSDFVRVAELLARATERFAVPYLLGIGQDFDAIKEIVRKRSEANVKRIKAYRFPTSVQISF